ncbi:hypothetical protein ACQEVM_37430 [Streptomyces sp. CA-243310]|uniref:hypothetical protein n=1 Tax=Streptomyces sp. CA-243310 TaxID=3240056 RepID=UPI003D8F1F71
MRAEESAAPREEATIEQHRMTGKGTLRTVTTWLPIHQLTTEQVWKIHRDNAIPHHQGLRPGHCAASAARACPLAHTDDLIRSAQLNPETLHRVRRRPKPPWASRSRRTSRSGKSSTAPGS